MSRPSAKQPSASQSVRVGVLIGSLREASFSRKIANALIARAPDGMTCTIIEIGALPLYNQDLDDTPPQPWVDFRSALAECDALLFVTPEYNRSIPGVLKNAIDVGSRPYGKSSFLGKPVGIVSNSPGPLGGVSAAKHLQNILPGISGPILGQPEIYLNAVGDAFDEKGECTKEALQKVLQQYIDAFAAFIERQNR